MFLLEADFEIKPFDLPDLDDAVNSFEEDFIPEHEEEALRMVLGDQLYEEFIAGLYVDPAADPLVAIPANDVAQKWKDLRDGATYVDAGKTYRYSGVKKLLTPYVYAKWLEETEETLTGVGTVVSNTENASNVGNAKKITKGYNKFRKLAGNCEENLKTLYGFLQANTASYPNWDFTEPGFANTFGL